MRLPKYDAPVLIFYLPFEVRRIVSDHPFSSRPPDRVASGAALPEQTTSLLAHATRAGPDARQPKERRWRERGSSTVDASAKPGGPKQLLPGKGFLLQVTRPRDAFLVSGCFGREEPGVGLEPHPPQVQTVGVPAYPDGLVFAEFAVGVFFAGERQQLHLLVPEVVGTTTQVPGQDRGPRAVHGVDTVVDPHGVVKEGEQEDERGVGVRRLRQEGEARRADPFPVVLTVYGRVLARGPLENGVNEPGGIRYTDAGVRGHPSQPGV